MKKRDIGRNANIPFFYLFFFSIAAGRVLISLKIFGSNLNFRS